MVSSDEDTHSGTGTDSTMGQLRDEEQETHSVTMGGGKGNNHPQSAVKVMASCMTSSREARHCENTSREVRHCENTSLELRHPENTSLAVCRHKGPLSLRRYSPSSLSLLLPRWWSGKGRRLLVVSLTLAALTAVTVGLSAITTQYQLHVALPASLPLRKVRAFSHHPQLSSLVDSETSLSLVSRLQLLDLMGCQGNLSQCQTVAVCDGGDNDLLCRCRRGYYFQHQQCHECRQSCPDGHYLLSPCSASSDAVCTPCTMCSGSQYEAAVCTSTRDTICVDVTFPVGILAMNGTQLKDDGTPIEVAHSSNVFMERLVYMKELETPMYVTNNQQTQDFVWHRESGIDIVVGISGVYLIPEYRELEAEDDSQFFLTQTMETQQTLDLFSSVQRDYCRHPVPDYYYLHLEVIRNRTTAAQVVRCDSQDPTVPKCPKSYKDGDRFLKWDINRHCDKYNEAIGQKPDPLTVLRDGFNTVVCGDETAMDRDIFRLLRPVTLEMMLPSAQCNMAGGQCQLCRSSDACSGPDREASCCGLSCYTKESCQTFYSPTCPPAQVECASGEVHMFTVMPMFQSMSRQWQCHLSYQKPAYLYNISYSLSIPSLGVQVPVQTYSATSDTLAQHRRHSDVFHFIQISHNTRLPIHQDVLLKGDHRQLNSTNMNHMQPYVLHSLKNNKDFSRRSRFFTSKKGESDFTTAVQFERPFVYSSTSWYKSGCDKNTSRIFPNQTLYRNDAMKVTAKKVDKAGNFWYQVHSDRFPYIKLSVPEGESVLRWVQGKMARGILVPDTLSGSLSWDPIHFHWRIAVSGTVEKCPAIMSLHIFNKMMSACIGLYDIIVACPNNFTLNFNLSRTADDLPDIFVVIINDTMVSHQLVLSSVITPVSLPVSDRSPWNQTPSSVDKPLFHWSSILGITLLFGMGLGLVFAVYVYIKHSSGKAIVQAGPSSGQQAETAMLNNQSNNSMAAKPADNKHSQNPFTKTCLCVFVVLYMAYSLIFTFCVTLTILYFTHHALIGQVGSVANFSNQLQAELNTSFHKVQLHESQEEVRLFQSVGSRLQACAFHLHKQNQEFLHSYVDFVSDFLSHVYLQDGAVDSLAGQSIVQNTSIYAEEIKQFLVDCNKTVQSVLDRFDSHYLIYVKEMIRNGWLDFPREIFLTQEGDPSDRKYMSSDQRAHFLHWLQLGKSNDMVAASSNMASRLASLHLPSPTHHLKHTVTSPFYTLPSSLPTEAHMATHTFLVLDRPDSNSASPIFHTPSSTDSLPPQPKAALLYSEGASSKVDVHSQRNGIADSDNNSADTSHSQPLLGDDDDRAQGSDGQSSAEEEDEPLGVMVYIMIGIFLLLDVLLFAFRMSWMVNQLTAAKAGYEDRIPTDPVCQKLLAIQTGYHLTRMQDMYQSHSYCLENKENVTIEERGSESEFNVYFCQSYPKSKDDILREIMAQKMNSTENSLGQDIVVDTMQRPADGKHGDWWGMRQVCSCVHWLYRMLLSHLLWRFLLTLLLVVLLCLLVYTVDFWLTTDSMSVLIGGQSAMRDLYAQVHMTNHHLAGVASHLSAVLQEHTAAVESEVSWSSTLISSTLTTQRKMLRRLLEEVCSGAGTPTCNVSSYSALPVPALPTWKPCNFIPAQPLLYQDVGGGSLDEMVAQQLSPMLQTVKHSVFSLCAIIVAVVCIMFLCHAGATVARYYLLVRGYLPRVPIFQISENTSLMFDGAQDKPMQRSASWLESCESGVYVGESEPDHTTRDV